MITKEYLQEILNYDPLSGTFVWKYRISHPTNWNNRFVGKQAGSKVFCNGLWYINIAIDRQTYKAHRLAWLYVYGEFVEFIDHKDGDGLHNWINNLRESTRSQNLANSHKEKRGVFLDNGKYRSMIRVEGHLIHLGVFDSKELAQAVYDKAALDYFGDFARCSRL